MKDCTSACLCVVELPRRTPVFQPHIGQMEEQGYLGLGLRVKGALRAALVLLRLSGSAELFV